MRCLKCGSYNVYDAIEENEIKEPLLNRVTGINLHKLRCNDCSSLSTYREQQPISYTLESGERITENEISNNEYVSSY